MKEFSIHIKCNRYWPHLFELDDHGLPMKMITIKAKNMSEAYIKLKNCPPPKNIPEYVYFEQFVLKELK